MLWSTFLVIYLVSSTLAITPQEEKTTDTSVSTRKNDQLVTVTVKDKDPNVEYIETESKLCKKKYVSDEERLIKDIFEGYDPLSRPKHNSSENVEVAVKFVLMQLNNLDEKSQVLATSGWMEVDEKVQILATSGWMEVEWNDERLTWDPKDYGGLDSVVVSSQMLWLPDIALQNSAEEIYHSSFQDKKFRITISSTGFVFWIPGGKFYTNCELDIQYFPFDDQMCKLHFTNWAYTGLQVNLTTGSSEIPLQNYKINGEWDIVKTKAYREDVYFYCCPEVPYPSVYFTLYMRRKFLFHLTNIITPCLMLSVLVALVFYLPPDAGEKISLGITVLLSFSVFLLLIAESMPRISESVPVISIYLSVFMAMTTISIFMTVVVLNLHHRGNDHPVPKWIRRLVFGCMAKMLCMRHIVPPYIDKDMESSDYVDQNDMTTHLTTSDHIGLRLSKRGRGSFAGDISPCRYIANGTDGNKLDVTQTNTTTRYMEEIVQHLRVMNEKRIESEEAETQKDDWKIVARIVDRFLFIMSFSIIFISSILVLGVIPLSKPPINLND